MRASDQLLGQLLALHPKRIDLSLDRLTRLLDRLDNPEQRCPPVIHIAGTNGKGSTLSFLKSILEADGQRVHSYTSPHLVTFHERIQCAGEQISEARLAACLSRCEQANAGAPITFFEITTAAAFLAFSETAADWLLLEVGLGGRLDATNVITPEISVITPISIDHQEFLGQDLTAIAAEKAGIIKPNRPVISAPQEQSVREVIEATAQALNAPLQSGGVDWMAYSEHGRLVFQNENRLLDLPMPALHGGHQITNAGTAIATACALDLPEAAIARGVQKARWPARLQRLKDGEMVQIIRQVAPKADIWLDGGHNAAAASILADWLHAAPQDAKKPTTIICGLLNTKSAQDFLTALTRHGPNIQLLTISIPDQDNAIPGEELANHARKLSLHAKGYESPLTAAEAVTPETERVLICGSLYLAGWVLARGASFAH